MQIPSIFPHRGDFIFSSKQLIPLTRNIISHAMHKYLFLLFCLISAPTSPLRAQEYRVAIAVARIDNTIKKAPNGKYQLWKHPDSLLIDNADSIVFKKREWYYIRKDGRQGLYDRDGKVVIPIEYNRIEQLSGYLFLIEKDGKKGVFNTDGRKILDTIFDEIENKGYEWSDKARLYVRKNGKYGLCNERGEYLAQPIYNEIKGNFYKLELVKDDGTDYLLSFKHFVSDGITILDKFVLETDGIRSKDFYIFRKDTLCGLLDEEGKVFMKPQYTKLVCRDIGYRFGTTPWLIACKGNNYGTIDIYNNVILPFQYKSIRATSIVGCLAVETEAGKRFYDYETKKFINDYTFDEYHTSDLYTAIKKDGKTTLISNDTKKMMFPYKYQDVFSQFYHPYFCVKLNNLYGLVDANDKIIIPIMYEDRLWITCGDKIVIKKDGKYGIINLKNELLYGMINHIIVAYDDFFDIYDSMKENTRLDADLNVIQEANK